MKLLWQNKFEGFYLSRTSPLYYSCSVERDRNVLNCYYYDIDLGITETSRPIGSFLFLGSSGVR